MAGLHLTVVVPGAHRGSLWILRPRVPQLHAVLQWITPGPAVFVARFRGS